MTRGTLWIEITIAGSLYVMSLFFMFAGIYGNSYLGYEAHRFNSYLTYVAVGVVALSYIVGFVAHRVIQIFNWRLLRWARLTTVKAPKSSLKKERTSRLTRFDEFVIRDEKDNPNGDPKSLEERMAGETVIWALNPQRIHNEIDFQFGQVALLRSLIWSTLLLASSVLFWRIRTGHHATAFAYGLVSLAFLVFWVCLLLASRRQSTQYEMIRDNALEAARRLGGSLVPSLSPTSGRAGDHVMVKSYTFGKTKENCTVTFGGQPAKLFAWEPTRIDVLVPEGGTLGDVNVRVMVCEMSDDTGIANMQFTFRFKVLKS